MSLAPHRRTSGRSPARAWIAASLDSTQGHGRGLVRATEVSSRGECGNDGWVPTGGVAPLSWRFLVRSVLSSASSGILSSSVWEKSTVGRTMLSISPSETLCIVSSSLMCPARSGVFAYIEGEFSADLEYLESPKLSPKLAADMASLSGLVGGLGDAILTSVYCALFESLLPLPTAAGVAVLGAVVSVSAWDAWVVSAQVGKAGHSTPLVRTLGENNGVSG